MGAAMARASGQQYGPPQCRRDPVGGDGDDGVVEVHSDLS